MAEGSSPEMWWPRRAAARAGIRHRDRVDQAPGVGMGCVLVDLLGRSDLHQLAEVHDPDAVGEILDHRQVVRDDDVRQVVDLLKALHQVEELSLDGHVEGGDRLVADDEPRAQGERTGEADPLTLAAGELVRVELGGLAGEADFLEQLLDSCRLL